MATCQQCGKEVPPQSPRGPKQPRKYCCRRCMWLFGKQRERGFVPHEIHCLECGKKFVPHSRRSRHCSRECQRASRRIPQTSRPCKRCGKEFVGLPYKKFCCHPCMVRFHMGTDRQKAYQQRYKKAHPEKYKEWRERWYRANREKIRQQARSYRQANLEKCQEYERKYRQANRDRINHRKRQRQQEKKLAQSNQEGRG